MVSLDCYWYSAKLPENDQISDVIQYHIHLGAACTEWYRYWLLPSANQWCAGCLWLVVLRVGQFMSILWRVMKSRSFLTPCFSLFPTAVNVGFQSLGLEWCAVLCQPWRLERNPGTCCWVAKLVNSVVLQPYVRSRNVMSARRPILHDG